MGLPLACVLLPSRQCRVLLTCQPLPSWRAVSHCRFGSAGCAGIWQLRDEMLTVWCRSRFVLLAQQANSSLMRQFAGTDPHDVERRRRVSHASEESSHRPLGAWTNDGIFITLWKLAAWPWQHKTPSLPHRCG